MDLFLIGAGHVGLVTAVGFTRLGHHVTVHDIDAARLGALRAGLLPIYEPGLNEALEQAVADGSLKFTGEPDPPTGCAASFVCVNTPSGPAGPLSMANVDAVVGSLLDRAPADHVVVIRSTLPLDGPDRLLVRAQATATARRERPALVTNPEFMREGAALADFENPSRVVVGWLERTDLEAAERIAALYEPLGAPTLVADARSVALIKLAGNVFLAGKIAFANELARLSEVIGADVSIVARGLGLDPRIGSAFLVPGPGFGGTCLPEQAIGLAQQAAAIGLEVPLLSAIAPANARHQQAVAERLANLLGASGSLIGRRIAVFGLAFKANTDDVHDSPALALVRLLREAGADLVGYDPRAEANARRVDPRLALAETPLEAAVDADAILIATEWAEFGALDWDEIARVMRGRLVFDTRNVVHRESAARAGIHLVGLGRPD